MGDTIENHLIVRQSGDNSWVVTLRIYNQQELLMVKDLSKQGQRIINSSMTKAMIGKSLKWLIVLVKVEGGISSLWMLL